MIEQRRAQEKGYITLKEAADISNYSPDYVGQLIRAGKIEGQQVYSNVAWVTTEASVREYLAAKNKSLHKPEVASNVTETAENFSLYILYLVVGLLAVSLITLLYIFAVSLDKAIERKVFSESAAPEGYMWVVDSNIDYE